jgi:hypothetical protein
LHVKPHCEDAQAGVALGRLGQAWLQAPQCAGVVARSTSHPVEAFVSQSSHPLSQASPHPADVHTASEFAPLGHALPQPRQWSGPSRFASHPFDPF